MAEQFILHGKKKKEWLKKHEYTEAKQYLKDIKVEDEQQKVIRQAKQEKFRRSKVGKVIDFLGSPAGVSDLGKKKKGKKKKRYDIRQGKGDPWFGKSEGIDFGF